MLSAASAAPPAPNASLVFIATRVALDMERALCTELQLGSKSAGMGSGASTSAGAPGARAGARGAPGFGAEEAVGDPEPQAFDGRFGAACGPIATDSGRLPMRTSSSAPGRPRRRTLYSQKETGSPPGWRIWRQH